MQCQLFLFAEIFTLVCSYLSVIFEKHQSLPFRCLQIQYVPTSTQSFLSSLTWFNGGVMSQFLQFTISLTTDKSVEFDISIFGQISSAAKQLS